MCLVAGPQMEEKEIRVYWYIHSVSEIETSILILLNDTNLIMEKIKDQDKNSPLSKKGLEK